ncbi:hypothetical protein RRG08_065450 [Elysia crispata]|uniref:Sushi domain-containing protein n=1 Tax=Elysia crispata TaxID=231223 RepID=A0AAE0XVI0_9GAST|nr:hypothetical protein RRG08_065450 [Elysia crispata]
MSGIRQQLSLSSGYQRPQGKLCVIQCRPSHAARFFSDSGNKERVCLASGKWSGSKLTCRNVCPRSWKYNLENKMCYEEFNKCRSYFKALK